MRWFLTLWFLSLLFLLAPAPAYAYLDPATGSLLLYALVGIATTAAFGLSNLWYALKGHTLLGAAVGTRTLPDIVFHSEGGSYWPVFQPVIAALQREGVSCAYATPDPADPALASGGPRFQPIRPGKGAATIAWMNVVAAPLVVSTTPHLDVYMLKRSRKVRHYAHLFHAPTDVAFYEKFAFDYYDSLLATGSFQERSVRTLERRRGLAAKVLYPTGCTYYDVMLEEARSLPPRKDGEFTVLYAPTWGERSSVLKYGTAILDSLVRAGIRTIFRPHPQFYVSHRQLIAEIEKKAVAGGLLEIDAARTGTASMQRADVMIADLSGVLFDFAFLFERPILLANASADPGGQEAEDLEGEIWDVAAAHRLARVLADGEIAEVCDIVRDLHHRPLRYQEAMREVRDGELYNFGRAGQAAAGNILSILRGLG